MSDPGAFYRQILSHFDAPPVLIDVGASGYPPATWSDIASASIFVGFDPDLREMREPTESGYSRCIIINKAVTDKPDKDRVRFYLTSSPYCSSTLPPDHRALEQYIFSDLFTVESEITVEATTLDEVVRRVRLPHIDWIKVDTQGTDLRLFTGMSEDLRSGVLAIDVEPGLIDGYLGEDLYVDAHTALTRAGFWLSHLEVKGAVRIKKTTREALIRRRSDLQVDTLQKAVRPTPGWCEARYLRTIESLVSRRAPERDHALLWIFAMIDGQLGFGLDIAFDFRERFPESPIGALLTSESLARLDRAVCSSAPPANEAVDKEALSEAPIQPLLNARHEQADPAGSILYRLRRWVLKRR